MAVPSDYAEARDPRTSGARLGELARLHPELQPLIVLNPGCPGDLRAEIMRVNPSAKRVVEERQAAEAQQAAWVQDPGSGTGPRTESGRPDGAEVGAGAAAAGGSAAAGWSGEPTAAMTGPVTSPVPEQAAYPAASAGGQEPPTGTGPLPRDMFEPATQSAPRRSRTGLWALLGCLVLLIPLGIGGYFGARSVLGHDGGDGQASASTSSSSRSASKSSASGGSSTSSRDATASPAPDGASTQSAVLSPSGNIACSLQGDTAGCSLTERSYGGQEDCPSGQAFSISVGDDSAALACGQTFGAQGAPTLQYDTSAKNGDVACTSESRGMTCWNVKTGHGFRVSKSSYETF